MRITFARITWPLVLFAGHAFAAGQTQLTIRPRASGDCFTRQDLRSMDELLMFLPASDKNVEIAAGPRSREKCRAKLQEILTAKHFQVSLTQTGESSYLTIKAAAIPAKSSTITPVAAAAGPDSAVKGKPQSEKVTENEVVANPSTIGTATGAANKGGEDQISAEVRKNIEAAEKAAREEIASGRATESFTSNLNQDSSAPAANPKAYENIKKEPSVPWQVAYRLAVASFTGTGLSSNSSGILPLAFNLRLDFIWNSKLELDAILPVALSSKTAKALIGHGLIMRPFTAKDTFEWGLGGALFRTFTSTEAKSLENGSQLLDQLAAPEGRVRGFWRGTRYYMQGDIGLMPTFNSDFKPSISYLYEARFVLPRGADSYFIGFHAESFAVAAATGAAAADMSMDTFFIGYSTVF